MKIMNFISLAICTHFIGAGISSAQGIRFTGLSLGLGNWTTINDGDRENREEYGTWPALGLYAGNEKWRAAISLPVKTTFKKVSHETRLGLGDGEVSLGRNIGNLTPRLALQMPFYEWSVEDALVNELFIGGGNVRIGLGLGAKMPPERLSAKLRLVANLEAFTAITKGLADYGSSHAMGSLNAEYTLTRRWRAGMNMLFLFDYWKWIPTYWDYKEETKFSLVPGASLGVRLGRATYVDIKGGSSVYTARYLVEPRFPDKPQTSSYYGFSVYQGF